MQWPWGDSFKRPHIGADHPKRAQVLISVRQAGRGSSRNEGDSRLQRGLMKYRMLGSSDLRVSEISLGSWLTYGVGVERQRAVACVDRAFDLGINFIDTANVY